MSKIENYSIFGNYKQEENRVTAALLHILKIGGTEFIGNVISEIEEIDFPSSEINIITQERESNNIYDGLLECNFSFRVLVESKVKTNSVKTKQLKGLISNAKECNGIVLYITPDSSKPKELDNSEIKIYWANWKEINRILKEINNKTEPLNFLILEFEKYLDSLNLLEVIDKEDRVQIVAGSRGEPIALKYNFYACQNYRTYRPSRYLAFYNNRGIHSLFEIIGVPIDNTDLSSIEGLKEYLQKYEPNYSRIDRRQYYKLKFIKKLNINHDKVNSDGKRTAYTMGVFRYTTISKINIAQTTDDL